jgi:hypothetical protein
MQRNEIVSWIRGYKIRVWSRSITNSPIANLSVTSRYYATCVLIYTWPYNSLPVVILSSSDVSFKSHQWPHPLKHTIHTSIHTHSDFHSSHAVASGTQPVKTPESRDPTFLRRLSSVPCLCPLFLLNKPVDFGERSGWIYFGTSLAWKRF